MLQNYATIPLYITHKNVTFCHEGTGVQKGFLVAACLLACSLFKHPLLSTVSMLNTSNPKIGNSGFTFFPFIPRPYPPYIDLNTLCSTSLLWLFVVLARVLSISLGSHLIFRYIHRTLNTNTSNHFQVGYWHLYPLISLFRPYRNCLPELRTI